MNQDYIRGGSLVISLDLLNQMLKRELGFLDLDHIEIKCITTEHWNQAAKISILTDHTAFPILEPQKELPLFIPEIIQLQDGKPYLKSIMFYT